MKRLLAVRGSSAALVGVVALLVAGGGYALASGGGTIHACVKKGNHLLYTGRCKKGDKKLSWNQTGPRGPKGATGSQGARGPAGAQGAQGPEGPSSGFSTYQKSVVSIPLDNAAHTVASLTLPAGSYMVIAKTLIYNSSASYATDTCDLVPPGGSYNNGADIDESSSSTGSNNAAEETMSLVGPLTTTGGTVSLQCTTVVAPTSAYDTHLTAIKLGSVAGT